MNIDEKRDFLTLYPLQLACIERLTKQSSVNADRKNLYQSQIEQARALRNDIEELIDGLPDQLEREILAQKYLCGRTLEETAGILNYSKRQIERLHLRALEHLPCPEAPYGTHCLAL